MESILPGPGIIPGTEGWLAVAAAHAPLHAIWQRLQPCLVQGSTS